LNNVHYLLKFAFSELKTQVSEPVKSSLTKFKIHSQIGLIKARRA